MKKVKSNARVVAILLALGMGGAAQSSFAAGIESPSEVQLQRFLEQVWQDLHLAIQQRFQRNLEQLQEQARRDSERDNKSHQARENS